MSEKKTLRILLAQDNLDALEQWKEYMTILIPKKNQDVEVIVETASTYSEVEEKLTRQAYDCLVADYFLAGAAEPYRNAGQLLKDHLSKLDAHFPKHVFLNSSQSRDIQRVMDELNPQLQAIDAEIAFVDNNCMHWMLSSEEYSPLGAQGSREPASMAFAKYLDEAVGTAYEAKIRKLLKPENIVPAPNAENDVSQLPPLKILVVEDDPLSMEQLMRQLATVYQTGSQQRKMDVHVATSAKEALAAMREQSFDWMIADYYLSQSTAEDMMQDMLDDETVKQPDYLFLKSRDLRLSRELNEKFQNKAQSILIPMSHKELEQMELAHMGVLDEIPETRGFTNCWDEEMGDDYYSPMFEAYKSGSLRKAKNPEDAYKLVRKAVITPMEATKAVDVERLPSLYPGLKKAIPLHEKVQRMRKGETFEGTNFSTRPVETSMGVPATGYLAFNMSQVEQLRQAGKQAILVTDDFDLTAVSNFADISAVIYSGESFEHLRSITDNNGIRAIDLANYANAKMLYDTQTGELNGFALEDTAVSANGVHSTKQFSFNEPFSIQNDGQIHHQLMVPEVDSDLAPYEEEVMGWLEEARIKYDGLGVNINADSAAQLEAGLKAAREALGLARSENMVLSAPALEHFKAALLNDTQEQDCLELTKHLAAQLLPMFQLGAEHQLPSMAIRLFDPNLPNMLAEAEVEQLTEQLGEENLAGAQLGLAKPHLYQANIRAILQATKQSGYEGKTEIVVPHIKTAEEFAKVKEMVQAQAQELGVSMPDVVPMVETLEMWQNMPRIVKMAPKRYYGTNDLTQKITGIESRTSADAKQYFRGKIDESITRDVKSPFVALTKTALDLIAGMEAEARKLNPTSEGCICGAHASDAETIAHLHRENIGNISVPAMHMRAAKAYAGKAAAFYSNRVDISMLPAYTARTASSGVER